MKSEIDEQIDKMPMHEMSGEEMMKKINPNSLKARLRRRDVRYKLYCLKKEAENTQKGIKTNLPESITEEFREAYSSQQGFDGFEHFSINWDVELHDPATLVHRMFSEEEEWQRIVLAKFPQIGPDGNIKYPDLRVKEAVDAEAKLQAEKK